jgi:uncharacterized protein involved in exopolysaccharide biosynthesis
MSDILGDLISGLIEQRRWGCLIAVVAVVLAGLGAAIWAGAF